MIAGLLIGLGIIAGVVILWVLRNGKQRDEAWEEFWAEQRPMTKEERRILREQLGRQDRKGGRP